MNCPFCNFELPDGAMFCGSCGKKLSEVQEQPAETAETVETTEIAEVTEAAGAPVQETEAAEVAEAVETVEESAAEAQEQSGSVLSSTFAPPETAVEVTAAAETDTPAEEVAAVETVEEVAEVSEAVQETVSEAAESVSAESTVTTAEAPVEAVSVTSVDTAKAEAPKAGGVDIGAAVQEDVQQAAAAIKNKDFNSLFKSKTFIVCAVLIVLVLLIIIVAGVSAAAAGGSKYETKGSYYFVESDDEGFFFYNGKQVKGIDLTDNADAIAYSPDGTTILVEDEEDLYIIKSGKATLITDEFDTSTANISSNGKTVTYISDDTLFVYTGGKSKQVAELENDSFCEPVISPDGKIVAYADYDDDDIKTYVWKGGKAIDLDSDIVPFSVSNGGKFIYGVTRDGELYYIKGMKANADEKIDGASRVIGIDYDHTKLFYVSDGGTYCYDPSLNKEDGVRIDKSIVYPYASDYYMISIPYIENFKSFYGLSNDNVYKYTRKGKEYNDDKVLSDVSSIRLSEDFKSFVYIDDDDNLMKGTLSNAKNEKEVDSDVRSIRANKSLKNVFYLDDDYNLRYMGKDDKIASDVDRYLVTEGGICVFYDEDDDLYYSVKGGAKKDAGLSDVSYLTISNNVVFVVADDELYISTNGKSFKSTGIEVN